MDPLIDINKLPYNSTNPYGFEYNPMAGHPMVRTIIYLGCLAFAALAAMHHQQPNHLIGLIQDFITS